MKTLRLSLGFLFALLLSVVSVKAHPYASGITVDTNANVVHFILNESNAVVSVVFGDGTTNVMGTLQKGPQAFALGANTTYSIYVTKVGNGTPALISSDTGTYNQGYAAIRGIDVNKNPKIGTLFGRTYVENALAGTRSQGIFQLNADLTDSPVGSGNTAANGGLFTSTSGSSPYRLTVASNGDVYATSYATADATVYKFAPDLSSGQVVLSPVGELSQGNNTVHGDPVGVFASGSVETGDLVLYTSDPALSAPSSPSTLGDNTSPGDFNLLSRYDIGAGPLPWNQPPNFSVSVGLQGFYDSQILDLTIEDNGNYLALFRRANLSHGCIQVYSATGHQLYTSLNAAGTADVFQNAYAGVRISPDKKFMATLTINNAILVASLTNGIPDESTLVTIANTPTLGNARGIAFDAADNILATSSGTGFLRVYSLNLSTTAVTSNDKTGTNGTYSFALPPVNASLVVTTPVGSQNYVNSTTHAGVPIPAVFTINLTSNYLAAPVTVNIALSGTAVYRTNYNINSNLTSTVGNPIIITTTNVIFPAGLNPAPGNPNWSAQIQIIPTATPVSGPTYTVGLKINGGATYFAQAPVSGTVSIANTGPQQLVITAASTGATMYRGISNDYARFTITRNGDTNGPGNDALSISQNSYTVTNFTLTGTALNPRDYTAGPQNLIALTDGSKPVDGLPGIVIPAGAVTVNALIGNPVLHTNLYQTPSNVTVIVALTNQTTPFTNLLSSEGKAYTVTTATTTLTEVDNSIAPENVTFYSNPLTNAADSVNWTLTFQSTNMSLTTVPPVRIPNYSNVNTVGAGSNDFDVIFGADPANDAVPYSPTMLANGWTKALRMTVNKNTQSAAGVNLYPQGQSFKGNYALRFNMYLSLASFAINQPAFGNTAIEFALFGMNHSGNSCNWRPAVTPIAGTGEGLTNIDGTFAAVDATTGSLTPADYDSFLGSAFPNSNVVEPVSAAGSTTAGVFKHPPFQTQNAAGGMPVNKWVDVSMEITSNNLVSVMIDNFKVLTTWTNLVWTNGTIMLGYEDPLGNEGDYGSQFVYFSNVRVLELAPSITNQAVSLLVTQGANVSFTTSGALATSPVTNKWITGASLPTGATLQTDTNNATTITSTLSLTNVTAANATNYWSVLSDVAGSITGTSNYLEVVAPLTNVFANTGINFSNKAPVFGPATVTYQWQSNGVALVNVAARVGGATAQTLILTNTTANDSATYTCVVTTGVGSIPISAVFSFVSTTVTPATVTTNWGAPVVFSVGSASGATYQWKRGATILTNGGEISGATTSSLTLNPVTQADAGSYTVTISNATGVVTSTTGVLTVLVPAPNFKAGSANFSVSGGNSVLQFTSSNVYDTTNAFTLQTSTNVAGPYTNTSATIVGSAGSFQVTTPQNGPQVFYRLIHN